MIVQELWKVSFGKKSFNGDPWVKIEEAWEGADSDFVIDNAKEVVIVVVAVEKKDCMTEREKKEIVFRKALVNAAWGLRSAGANDVLWFRTLRDLAEYGA